MPSGNSFTWKVFPNKQVSKFPTAVKNNIKSNDPKYPPNRVCNCEELNHHLNICIPENINTELIEANKKEIPVVTAKNK